MADLDGREPESIQHVAAHRGAGADAASPVLFHPLTTCLLAGLAAGLLAFGLGEMSYDAYKAKLVPTNMMGSIAMLPSAATQEVATIKNSVLAYAELGAMLGLYLGLAGGLVRKSAPDAGIGGVLGLILGGVLGAALPLATFPVFFRAIDQLEVDPIVIGLGLHIVAWGLLGGAAGLAFAYALGKPRRMLHYFVLGFIGAALGTGAFEAVGGILYPLAKTDQPLAAAWQARLLARMLVTIGTAAAIGLSFRERSRVA
ncbi:MAG: hypothetical protein P4L85_03330 [Paludisphaera borealis]|uniref:hypothetical protein n=1 Tax=Paludisphaera borealis TaxID=1387353 RepID=UPI00284A3721|nr:hypothetical protein [Paludisphaera borealis]MDR3618357.1 hypothetical protein [Paludisphaera borealis]